MAVAYTIVEIAKVAQMKAFGVFDLPELREGLEMLCFDTGFCGGFDMILDLHELTI